MLLLPRDADTRTDVTSYNVGDGGLGFGTVIQKARLHRTPQCKQEHPKGKFSVACLVYPSVDNCLSVWKTFPSLSFVKNARRKVSPSFSLIVSRFSSKYTAAKKDNWMSFISTWKHTNKLPKRVRWKTCLLINSQFPQILGEVEDFAILSMVDRLLWSRRWSVITTFIFR